MPVPPQAALFPRLQHALHATRTAIPAGPPQLIPIDSSALSDTIVHVVYNDAARAKSLTEFFLSHSISVNVFRTANEYIANTESDRIACVILDLDLPDISGLEAQSRLADKEGPPVVFVTARGDLNSGVCAMKNGAIDFMMEPVDHSRLLAAVENAFAQERNNRRKRVERLSLLRRWGSLTPREQDVFQYAVTGFLNKQGAAELGITENTFQVHRGRVMKKMKADSLAELVRMSTQLESLVHPQRENCTATQSLKTFLKGQVKESSRGLSTSIQTRHSGTSKISALGSGGIESLSYVNDRTASQARYRLAQRGV